MLHSNVIYFPRETLTFNLRDPRKSETFCPDFISALDFISRYSRQHPKDRLFIGFWDYECRWPSVLTYTVENGDWEASA